MPKDYRAGLGQPRPGDPDKFPAGAPHSISRFSLAHCPVVRLTSPTVLTSARLVGRLTVPWTTGSGYGAVVPQSPWGT